MPDIFAKLDETVVTELLTAALTAAKEAAKKKWPTVKSFAENEMRKLIQDSLLLTQLVTTKKVSKEEAKILIELHKQAAKAVLLTIEGIGLIIAEAIINDSIDALRTPLNKAIGFSLL